MLDCQLIINLLRNPNSRSQHAPSNEHCPFLFKFETQTNKDTHEILSMKHCVMMLLFTNKAKQFSLFLRSTKKLHFCFVVFVYFKVKDSLRTSSCPSPPSLPNPAKSIHDVFFMLIVESVGTASSSSTTCSIFQHSSEWSDIQHSSEWSDNNN